MKQILLLFLTVSFLLSGKIEPNLYEQSDLLTFYKNKITEYKAIKKKTPEDGVRITLIEGIIKTISYDELSFGKPPYLKATTEKAYLDLMLKSAWLKNYYDNAESERAKILDKISLLEKQIQLSENEELVKTQQLQFALYKIQLKKLREDENNFKNSFIGVFETLQDNLKNIKFSAKEYQKKIEAEDKKLKDAITKENLLKMTLEISSDVDTQKNSEKAIIEVANKKDENLRNLIELNTLYLLSLIQTNDETFFNQTNQLTIYTKLLKDTTKYIALKSILIDMAKQELGYLTFMLNNPKENLFVILEGANTIFNKPIFVYNEKGISVVAIIKFLVIFILGYFIAWFYRNKFFKSNKFNNVSSSTKIIFENIGNYIILGVTLVIALNSIGLDLSSLALVVGALSIGIGFGLQNIVSNLIAGIILMFEKSIKIGHFIEINDTQKGNVRDIRIRATTITTNDNIDLIIPNSAFITNTVINWTLEDEIRRIHVPFGVAYGTKVEKVREVVLGALEKSDLVYIRDNANRKPDIWMVGMGASSVDFKLLVWIDGSNKPSSTLSSFLIMVYEALNENNISIPFPQMDLYVKELPTKEA